jgi:hypothetical protein
MGDVSDMDSSRNAQAEQAWMNQLQAECNAVQQECWLPTDRPATQGEMKAFFAGLQRLEAYCTSAQPTAARFDAVGLHAFSQQLEVVLKDISGARNVFRQPVSSQPGPATQRALDMKQQQCEVEEFSTRAMHMIAIDPASAEPMLAEALEKTACMFQAQKEFLQGMPSWGNEQLPRLEQDRVAAIVVLHMSLGHAATVLGKYQQARACYQTALAELGPAQHPALPNIQQALAQIAMLEAGRVRI